MHRRFSSRLDEFMRLSEGIIVAPGGIGTLLELFYVWQLLQLAMVDPRPVVLLGRDFWGGLLKWINETVLAHQLISPVDMDRVILVDTPDEAVAVIRPVFEAFRTKRREARAASRAAREENKKAALKDVDALSPSLVSESPPAGLNGSPPPPPLTPRIPTDLLTTPVTPVDKATDQMLNRSRRRQRARRGVAKKYRARPKRASGS
jgi:hypothetical protein